MSKRRVLTEMLGSSTSTGAEVSEAGLPQPWRRVAGLAKELKDTMAKIEKDANDLNHAAVDNWSMGSDRLAATFRLLVKQLKKAEGATPPEKR